jgi:hypothetical protein
MQLCNCLKDICYIASGSDYAQLSEELWSFFHRVYGGGPEVVLRPPCQRTGNNVGCNSSGNISQPPPLSRTIPVPPESPLGMTHAQKARSAENITSHGGASGMSGGMGPLVRPAGRAQSISSDNITVRMAALSASGNKQSVHTDSKGMEKGKEICKIYQ